ncbi:Rubredoxin 4 [Capsicum baccatum]|uniref:Rubredoxin 4 n=1 Tax=Capsicum baccatum TaxID=33114 RepID=A0A2G2W7T9_CAPBA|nr:Rubredoxin 4 [Capsicum baccatum]
MATTRAAFIFSLSSLTQPSTPKPKIHLTFPPFHLKSHSVSSFYNNARTHFNPLPKSIDVSKEDQPISEQQPEAEQQQQEEEKFDKRRLEEKFAVLNTGIYECRSCGYKYNEAVGDPSYPIPPGLPFDRLPEDWRCPTCGAAKSFFDSKSVEIAGFAQNQQYGLGGNTLTSGQKALLIYGGLLLGFVFFLSGYFLQ